MTNAERKWLAVAIGIAALAIVLGSQLLFAQPPASSQFVPAVPAAISNGAASTQPKITWSTTSINVILSSGETASSNLTFTSSQKLTNVTLGVVPQIAPFVTVQPSSISSLSANQAQSVHLSIAIPAASALGTYNGTLQLKSGTATFPQTVKIVVNVWQAYNNPTLNLFFLYPPQWNASIISSSPTPSVYIARLSEEYPGEGITIARTAGDLSEALSDTASRLPITSQSVLNIQSGQWILITQIEAASGLQFFTALTEQNGSIVSVGARSTQGNDAIIPMVLGTFTF